MPSDKLEGNNADSPALAEYLEKLICGQCLLKCSLLDPHCAQGAIQAVNARRDFEEENSDPDNK